MLYRPFCCLHHREESIKATFKGDSQITGENTQNLDINGTATTATDTKQSVKNDDGKKQTIKKRETKKLKIY